MGYSDLSNQAMTVISGAWLDPAKERPILARLSRIAPLLGDLLVAHENIVKYQDGRPKVSPEVAALTQKATELDARHDRLARGLHGLFDVLATLTDDAEEAEAWLEVQRQLFPDGLRITKRSYIDQAGEAERVDRRLSDASRCRLENFTLGGVPLMLYVSAWQAAGRELGEVETERRILAKEPPDRPTLREVRNAWIAAVKAIVTMLDWEKDLSEADRRRILEPLESELAKAEARKRAKSVVETKEEGSEETKAEVG